MESIIAVVGAVIGLVVGVVIGLKLAGRGDEARRQDLADRLTEAQVAVSQRDARVLELERQAASLQATLAARDEALQAEQQQAERMREAFASLSKEALQSNSQEFLKLAQQNFETLSKTAEGVLATRQEAIKGLVDPLANTLKRYETALKELEEKRQVAYTSLDERLKALAEAEKGLQSETTKLVNALRRPEVRGRWGEMQLHNAVELAGMSKHCDFAEQVAVEGGTQRPDMVINLPGGKQIVVDSKVPLAAFEQAAHAETPEARQACMVAHARQCRTHLESLVSKAYWKQFDKSPDCVVMFIPGESLFAAAVETDASLLDYGLQNRVMIATPATLIAMLYAVDYGWRQQTLADSARTVTELASEFYKRVITFAQHFQKVGNNLGTSVRAYNDAVGSLEGSLVVPARKLQKMGVADGGKEVPDVTPVEVITRQLGPELASLPPESAEGATTEDV